MSEQDEFPPDYEVSKLRFEMIGILNRAQDEIKMLRNRLAQVEPKAAAYDNLAIVLNLLPKQSVGMGEDIAWRFQRRMEELQREEAQKKGKAETPKAS